MQMHVRVWLSLIVLILGACSPDQVTGPGEVRWDRETCTRCSMAVSDRHFAAQVRGAPAGEKTRLYKFDDIGCAVIWLEQQSWKDDSRTEIWVVDHRSGDWLDAREASYIEGKISPMNYGLGAQAQATEGSLSFAQANMHILTSEKERHLHGGHNPMSHE